MKLIWNNVIGIYVTNWEQKYNIIRIDIYITAIEPAVRLPVIWNAMILMCRQCNCVGHLFGECQWLDVVVFFWSCARSMHFKRWRCQVVLWTIAHSTVCSGADQRRHQSSASQTFVRGIHRSRWIPRTNGQLRGKCFHLMTSSMVIACQTSPRLIFFKGQPQRNESSAGHLVMTFSWSQNFANNVSFNSELDTSIAAPVLSSVT